MKVINTLYGKRIVKTDLGLVFDECATPGEHLAAPARETERSGFRRTCRVSLEDALLGTLQEETRKGMWIVQVEFLPDPLEP